MSNSEKLFILGVHLKSSINIFFASDESYSFALCTSIVSMLSNTKEFVNIYVLDSGIKDITKDKIEKSLKKFKNYHLEYVYIDNDYLKKYFTQTDFYLSLSSYSRFFIPKLKPNLDKFIYSDVDVIFTGDVKFLIEESLNDNVVGAIVDALYFLNDNYRNFNTRLKISKDHKYFNSGVLLVDSKKWINIDATNELLKIAKDSSYVTEQGDQDILNIVFKDYKELSVKYNATNAYFKHADKFNLQINNDLKKEDVIIRHYEGSKKPWNSNQMLDQDLFWHYAKQTKFYFALRLKYILYYRSLLPIIKILLEIFIPIKSVRFKIRNKITK